MGSSSWAGRNQGLCFLHTTSYGTPVHPPPLGRVHRFTCRNQWSHNQCDGQHSSSIYSHKCKSIYILTVLKLSITAHACRTGSPPPPHTHAPPPPQSDAAVLVVGAAAGRHEQLPPVPLQRLIHEGLDRGRHGRWPAAGGPRARAQQHPAHLRACVRGARRKDRRPAHQIAAGTAGGGTATLHPHLHTCRQGHRPARMTE
jgi:hypothetical protein